MKFHLTAESWPSILDSVEYTETSIHDVYSLGKRQQILTSAFPHDYRREAELYTVIFKTVSAIPDPITCDFTLPSVL
jgi:hypothetical protein